MISMEKEIDDLRLKLREIYSDIGNDLHAVFLKIDKTLEKLNGNRE
jgi:hypothetical protein